MQCIRDSEATGVTPRQAEADSMQGQQRFLRAIENCSKN